MGSFRSICPGSLFRLGVGVLLFSLWGCSGEIDREDELGVEQDEDTYELVILEADPEAAEDTTSTSPAAGEVGEDVELEAPIVFDPEGEFTVQIGVYVYPQSARQIVRELSAEGYPAYAIAGPDDNRVRVRIGYFKTREDAGRFGRLFNKEWDMDFWVDRRANE